MSDESNDWPEGVPEWAVPTGPDGLWWKWSDGTDDWCYEHDPVLPDALRRYPDECDFPGPPEPRTFCGRPEAEVRERAKTHYSKRVRDSYEAKVREWDAEDRRNRLVTIKIDSETADRLTTERPSTEHPHLQALIVAFEDAMEADDE